VRLRATMRSGRHALVTGTSFQILPPPAHGSRGHDGTTAPPRTGSYSAHHGITLRGGHRFRCSWL
jgi:hypothetical protein